MPWLFFLCQIFLLFLHHIFCQLFAIPRNDSQSQEFLIVASPLPMLVLKQHRDQQLSCTHFLLFCKISSRTSFFNFVIPGFPTPAGTSCIIVFRSCFLFADISSSVKSVRSIFTPQLISS